MTTIDVNTGGYVGHRNLEETIYRTNLEAAIAIARQLRLRNIGEHGVALDRYDPEPRRNTHTTRVNWLERLLVAPNHVHFHLEHHMFAAVPPMRSSASSRLS